MVLLYPLQHLLFGKMTVVKKAVIFNVFFATLLAKHCRKSAIFSLESDKFLEPFLEGSF